MAVLNVNVPDAAVPRIRTTAIGKIRNLGGDATNVQVEQEIKNYLKGLVIESETKTQQDAIVVSDPIP